MSAPVGGTCTNVQPMNLAGVVGLAVGDIDGSLVAGGGQVQLQTVCICKFAPILCKFVSIFLHSSCTVVLLRSTWQPVMTLTHLKTHHYIHSSPAV